MQKGDELPAVERVVTQAQIERYAAASGDFNPIHVDRDFAASSRFGGNIAHGMMIAATISDVMTTVFGRDWLESGRLDIRFNAPVFPGDTVTAFGHVTSVMDLNGRAEVLCSVGVRRQGGEMAITGKAAVVTSPAR